MIRFLRNFFFRDWLLKLFSLTLAILTWLAVSFSLRQRVVPVPGGVSLAEKTYFDLPVTLVSHDSDVSDFKTEPSELDVTIQGSENLLEELPRSSVRVIVDLSDFELKTPQELPVEIITPAGLSYVRIKPGNLVHVIPPPKTNQPDRTP